MATKAANQLKTYIIKMQQLIKPSKKKLKQNQAKIYIQHKTQGRKTDHWENFK